MFRTILNTAILPLELMSLGISSSELSAGASGWLLGSTVLTACPTALEWARRLFGDTAGLERSPPDADGGSRRMRPLRMDASGEA